MKPRPVLLGGAANIIVNIAAAYGLELSPEWIVGTLMLTTAVISFIQQALVRPASTSVDKD